VGDGALLKVRRRQLWLENHAIWCSLCKQRVAQKAKMTVPCYFDVNFQL
jgi:hypothetical protein